MIWLRAFVLLFSLLAANAQAEVVGNWLAGVAGGYADRTGTLHVRLDFGPGVGNVTTDVLQDVSDKSWIVGILAGYQVRCSHWIFGAEFNVDWNHLNNGHAFLLQANHVPALGIGTSIVTYDLQPTYGFTGRIGYVWAKYLTPYIRFGIETSEDRIENILAFNGTAGPLSYDISHRSWVRHYVAGGGIEIPICNFSVRLEYDYHAKGKTVAAQSFELDGPFFLNMADMKPKSQTGKIQLVWNF